MARTIEFKEALSSIAIIPFSEINETLGSISTRYMTLNPCRVYYRRTKRWGRVVCF
jgi:hypothetical protein